MCISISIKDKDMGSFAKGYLMNDLEFEVKVKGQGHLKNGQNEGFYGF